MFCTKPKEPYSMSKSVWLKPPVQDKSMLLVVGLDAERLVGIGHNAVVENENGPVNKLVSFEEHLV